MIFIKQNNEEMEDEMNKTDVKHGKKTYSEDANVDEAIPIQVRKEGTTEAYKQTMNQDIETIDKYEDRRLINKKQWRPIYEVIDEAYIKESNIFPDNFIRECLKNSNEPQFISSDVKNSIK